MHFSRDFNDVKMNHNLSTSVRECYYPSLFSVEKNEGKKEITDRTKDGTLLKAH